MNNSIVLKDVFPNGNKDYIAQAQRIIQQANDKTLYGNSADALYTFDELRALNNNHSFTLNVIEQLALDGRDEARRAVYQLLEALGSNRDNDDYAKAYHKGHNARANNLVVDMKTVAPLAVTDQLSY